MTPTERKPSTYGKQLTRRGVKPTTGRMEKFLHRLEVSGRAYSRWHGTQTFNQFIKANPTWSQRAWEVLVLENLELLLDNERQIAEEQGSTALRG